MLRPEIPTLPPPPYLLDAVTGRLRTPSRRAGRTSSTRQPPRDARGHRGSAIEPRYAPGADLPGDHVGRFLALAPLRDVAGAVALLGGDQRHDDRQHAGDHQDHPERVVVDPGDVDLDREAQERSRDQQQDPDPTPMPGAPCARLTPTRRLDARAARRPDRRTPVRSVACRVPTSYLRYVALGDSQTEGLNDGDDRSGSAAGRTGSPRPWRATTSPDLRYANLAIRGCRARDVRERQLDAALALRPDLASVVVGMNDLLRHDYDADGVVRDVEETIAALHGGRVPRGHDDLPGHRPDAAGDGAGCARARWSSTGGWSRWRARYDVPVLDLFPLEMCGDPALWSHDRIHGSSEGHRRIAAGMAEVMGLPGSDDTAGAASAAAGPGCSTPYAGTRGGRRPSSYRS